MAFFISIAILLPLDIGILYLSHVYGLPSMYGLVPATILAEISNTWISSSGVSIVSRQKGPNRPGGANFRDSLITVSPISISLGRKDSRTTTGMFPTMT